VMEMQRWVEMRKSKLKNSEEKISARAVHELGTRRLCGEPRKSKLHPHERVT
jgi:hypothetical protein